MKAKSNENIINALKEEGFAVKIRHFRSVPWDNEPRRYYRGSKKKDSFDFPCTKGGLTQVKLEKDGGSFIGIAKCSPKDNYCYKEGVRIAIERAMLNHTKFCESLIK